MPATFIAVLVVSEQADQAVVTSTLMLWRSLGFILGVAMSSLVVQNMLIWNLERNVTGPDKEAVGCPVFTLPIYGDFAAA